ncbi:MAG: hypothetical protein ACI3ZC_01345 [Candidatus Cryptobacteroides sp.]
MWYKEHNCGEFMPSGYLHIIYCGRSRCTTIDVYAALQLTFTFNPS